MLNVVIPTDKKKIERQIKALKYVLEHDTREIDKLIHSQSLESLQRAYDAI